MNKREVDFIFLDLSPSRKPFNKIDLSVSISQSIRYKVCRECCSQRDLILIPGRIFKGSDYYLCTRSKKNWEKEETLN